MKKILSMLLVITMICSIFAIPIMAGNTENTEIEKYTKNTYQVLPFDDAGLMSALYEYFTGTYTGNAASSAEVSYLNLLISFGDEESRVPDTVIDVKEYSKNL